MIIFVSTYKVISFKQYVLFLKFDASADVYWYSYEYSPLIIVCKYGIIFPF